MGKRETALMSDIAKHCQKITQRFLLTAIVVDDELNLSHLPLPHDNLKTPSSSTVTSEEKSENQRRPRSLNVDLITSSFLRAGMVCGVVSPEEGNDDLTLIRTLTRTDVVILDWQLSREGGRNALPLLERVLLEGPRHQLRLIAIYTGENDPQGILEKIAESVNGINLDGHRASVNHELCMIDFGACRIVIYLKKTYAADEHLSRAVSEEDLPDHLINDFASKVEGLLPSVVMTALTAVRENVYRVLARFGSDLDPAFLTHRACLYHPQESEQHIVEQIASELHGIMDDAITESSPAGITVIEHWLSKRFNNGRVTFSDKEYLVAEVLDMLKRGLEDKTNRILKPDKKFDSLSDGFSGGAGNSRALDLRLASAMSFRQVLDQKQRQLTMGTVIQRAESESEEFLICVTPKCDSVRLKKTTSFLFVPLCNPTHGDQIVVPIGENEFRHMSISVKTSGWRIIGFEPDSGQQCVLACSDSSDHTFMFRGVKKCQKYRWIGELKPEFAQSIAQKIAGQLLRIPLNKSEWLRRSEKKG